MMKLVKFALKYNLICALETVLIPFKVIGIVIWALYMQIRFKLNRKGWDLVADEVIHIIKDALRLSYFEDDEITEYCETEESSL